MPNRAYQPTDPQRQQVEALASYGVPEADIARVVGIDPKTLRKHYREELDTGGVKATAKVAESLFRKATSDGPQSVTAAIFWLKTRGGWREKAQDDRIDIHNIGDLRQLDLTRLTDAELDRLMRATHRVQGHPALPAPKR